MQELFIQITGSFLVELHDTVPDKVIFDIIGMSTSCSLLIYIKNKTVKFILNLRVDIPLTRSKVENILIFSWVLKLLKT